MAADGTAYHFEVDAFWDDRLDGRIRVCAYLCIEPQKRLLGFLPLFTADVSECLLVSPDGTVEGECSVTVDHLSWNPPGGRICSQQWLRPPGAPNLTIEFWLSTRDAPPR